MVLSSKSLLLILPLSPGFPTAYDGKESVGGAQGTKMQHKQDGAD